MKTRKIMPTTCLLMALLAMAALHFLAPAGRLVPPGWTLLGILPLALGVALNLHADAAFHRAQTTVRPFEESSALVTRGAFRLTRNPMYAGFVLILIGTAVLMGSSTPWLAAAAYAVLVDRVYITAEERMLAARFGPAWEAYQRRVRRWL